MQYKRLFQSMLAALLILAMQSAAAVAADTPQISDEAASTLASLTMVEEYFYYLDYDADYMLDTLLEEGVEDDKALASFVSENLLEGLPFYFDIFDLACSSFTALTPEGDYIQGRNFDLAGSQNILVHTDPENGYESLSTVSGFLLGYVDSMPESMVGRLHLMAAPYYPVDGINEKGLSVALLLLYNAEPTHQATGKPPITTTALIRLLLDKAATVEEAIALMDSYDMRAILNSDMHFHIADAQGGSVVVEYVDNVMQVIRSDKPWQVATNFFLSPDVIEDYRDGEDRLEALEAALRANDGVADVQEAMEMLESVIAVHDYDELTGIDYNTAYSIVFNNSQRSMRVWINMDFSKAYDFALNGE